MKWRRILGWVAVFLVMSGSMLGSEPEKRRQVRWSELKKLIGGKKVTLQLAEGARVEGRIRKVTDTSLVFKVKKSSKPVDYPKGKIQIPRETVSRIEVRGLKENKAMRVGATAGTFAGTLFASLAVLMSTGSDSGATEGEVMAAVAIPTAAAVLVYKVLAPKKITIIEILPDSPGERGPKPINKDSTPNPKQDTSSLGGETLLTPLVPLDLTPIHRHSNTMASVAADPSLVENLNPDRLRRQARRALMRPGALDGLKSD